MDLTHLPDENWKSSREGLLPELALTSEFCDHSQGLLRAWSVKGLTIADIIEYISLIHPATPHPNHVLISTDKEFQPCSITFRGYTGNVVLDT